ncbi:MULTISPECIES: hypothetical protein [unclassified Streptomyces]|uniref:hypothetical protein n=1 Tax=unclassified Streptomyces TaxID=2593676 RepID=UPI00224D4B7B|nr:MULTISPECIES: hypothetical protein [unclassified Streptomyces]MCX4405870.1 hypothetical protein [Streptomyces sp. NBC_01764]MCX5189607.1 hypothetical protein [Streptomyces sp. NBC_00268]
MLVFLDLCARAAGSSRLKPACVSPWVAQSNAMITPCPKRDTEAHPTDRDRIDHAEDDALKDSITSYDLPGEMIAIGHIS